VNIREGATFMSSTIEKVVKDIEIHKMKKMHKEYKGLFDVVGEFIIKQKLLLYGGLTINLLLPKNSRFYKEYTLNDYDCYSKNAINDAYNLAAKIKKAGYKHIKVRKALHNNTYRVYVEKKQVIDLTQMDKDALHKLVELSDKENAKRKYYKDKYIVLPISMVKRNLYYELARPEQSGWRWEKVYHRYKLFSKVYNLPKSKLRYSCIPVPKVYNNVIKRVLQYIKEGEYPIIDSYAIKFYLKLKNICCCRTYNNSKFLVILSNNYEKTKDQLFKLIKETLDNALYDVVVEDKRKFTDILSARYNIYIINKENNERFKLITIIQNKGNCFSVQKINGYTVGSIDTILYYLYCYYLLNEVYSKSKEIANEILYHINKLEDYAHNTLKNNIKSRLKIICYGDVNASDDINSNWKDRMTLRHIS
jgi:hypothetical protein